MNKITSFVATILAITAGSASALEFGDTGISFDNTIVAEYNTNTTGYTFDYTANLNYDVVENVNVYVETTIDLTNINYNGAELGVTWDIMPSVEAYSKVGIDAAGNAGDIFVGIEFTF